MMNSGLPLYFIQNNGQVDKRVRFYEKGSGHTTYFTKEGVYLALIKDQRTEDRGQSQDTKSEVPSLQFETIKLIPQNANKDPEIVAEGMREGKVNYFIGNDSKKWKTNIPTYKTVVYKELYKGIDMNLR